MAAIEIATHPLGLHFSKNKITVSTVGLVPEIERFCASTCTAQLAVSLHAPNDAIRSSIVPINRRYNLNALMACLRCDICSLAVCCTPVNLGVAATEASNCAAQHERERG